MDERHECYSSNGIRKVMVTRGEEVKNSNRGKLREFATFNELSISNSFKKRGIYINVLGRP